MSENRLVPNVSCRTVALPMRSFVRRFRTACQAEASAVLFWRIFANDGFVFFRGGQENFFFLFRLAGMREKRLVPNVSCRTVALPILFVLVVLGGIIIRFAGRRHFIRRQDDRRFFIFD